MMDLFELAERTMGIDLAAVPARARQALAQMLGAGADLADLRSASEATVRALPEPLLRSLLVAHGRWKAREQRLADSVERRSRQRRTALPGEALCCARDSDEIDALERVSQLCRRRAYADERAWTAALIAGLEMWRSGLSLASRQGSLRCEATEAAAGAPTSEYANLLRRREELADLPAHRWLAMRRGERGGALRIVFELPTDAIVAYVQTRLPELGEATAERTAASLAEELVTGNVEQALRHGLDALAADQAIAAAAQVYAGLLRAAPLKLPRLGVVYVGAGAGPLGVAVLDGNGQATFTRTLPVRDGWQATLLATLADRSVDTVALPSRAGNSGRLTEVRAALDKRCTLVAVSPAGLRELRQGLISARPGLSPPAAAAILLGRRALDPQSEWSRVDPVQLGLAEYQGDLDQARLRAALVEQRKLCQAETRAATAATAGHGLPGSPQPTKSACASGSAGAAPTHGSDQVSSPGATVASSAASALAGARLRAASATASNLSRLNPLLRGIDDLRPGMEVAGTISSISSFGAFVSIGLDVEGLIHVSELAEQFVSDPSQVVTLGQPLTARVLEIDRSRRRVSLSLRKGERPRGGGKGREQSRARALSEIERLFRK